MAERLEDIPGSEISGLPLPPTLPVLISSTQPAYDRIRPIQRALERVRLDAGYEGEFNQTFRSPEPQPDPGAWEQAGLVLLLLSGYPEAGWNFQPLVNERVKENRPLLLFALEEGDWGRVFPQVPPENIFLEEGIPLLKASEHELNAILDNLAVRASKLLYEAQMRLSSEAAAQKAAKQPQQSQQSIFQEVETDLPFVEESVPSPAGTGAVEPVPTVPEPYRTRYPAFQEQTGRFSTYARNIYYFACTLAESNLDGGPVAPVHLLFAFHQAGRRKKASTARLIKAEIDGLSPEGYRDLYLLGMPEDPRQLNKSWGQLPRTLGNHTPAVQRVFDQSDEIAQSASPEKEIRTRYLVPSFLALTPAEDPARRFLENAGVDWEKLRAAVKQILIDKKEDLNFSVWTKGVHANVVKKAEPRVG